MPRDINSIEIAVRLPYLTIAASCCYSGISEIVKYSKLMTAQIASAYVRKQDFHRRETHVEFD